MTALLEPKTVSTIAAPPMPPVESTDAFSFIPGSYHQETKIRAHAAQEPAWMKPALERVRALAEVSSGWGGSETHQLRHHALMAALNILGMVMSFESKTPQIVLTNEGGLQFEWHATGVDMEIEVRADGSAEVIVEDPANRLDVDGTLGEQLDLVRALLAQRLTI